MMLTLRGNITMSEAYIQIKWHISDILSRRPDLTDEECVEVLRSLKNNHDATIGINWETIDQTIDLLYPEG